MPDNPALSPRSLGYHIETTREVLLLNLDSVNTRFVWEKAGDRLFTCLCAMDARVVSADKLRTFCSHLLRLGCAYFCAWGPDCERVHDAMDRQVVGDDSPHTYLGCVMTTWHANDSLDDALFFFSTARFQTKTTRRRAVARL